MTASLQVRNWSRFQHYKNRRPPWIKLHRELLDDMAFASLSIEAKAVLPLLWILASESDDGSVPLDFKLLAFRLRTASNVLADAVGQLVGAGFLECAENTDGSVLMDALASAMLAPCKQPASAEERRGETEERESISLSPEISPSASLGAQELERLGAPRYGLLGGKNIQAIRALCPVTGQEWLDASRTQGESWAYFAKVVASMRERAASPAPARRPAREDQEPGWMRATRRLLEDAEGAPVPATEELGNG